jgi:hypothetical protein
MIPLRITPHNTTFSSAAAPQAIVSNLLVLTMPALNGESMLSYASGRQRIFLVAAD